MENRLTTPHAHTPVIVWAIDPFDTENKPSPQVIRKLMNWACSSKMELQPVHVLQPPQDAEAYFRSHGVSHYFQAAEKACQQYLTNLGIGGIRPVQILVEQTSPREAAVEKLTHFSEELGSPLLVVSSHGRSGLSRLFLGSFAESLLRQSSVPILFLSHLKPEDERVTPIEKVLFPTDFSDSSHRAFLSFLELIASSPLEVVLFHSVCFPETSIATMYGTPLNLPDDYLAEQEASSKTEAARWIQAARLHGVPARFVISNARLGPYVANGILELAETEKVDFIAMSSVSGPVSAFVAGSVAREVFRPSKFPVWIYGPKALEHRKEANRPRSFPPGLHKQPKSDAG